VLSSAGAYRVVGGRVVHLRTTKDGAVEIPLGNFTARISEVVTRDDGVEQTAVFAVEGQLADGRPLPRLQIPAADFQRLEWVTSRWHGEAVVFAGASTRDHLRCAIELLSGDRFRRTQYLHTGWREVNGRWIYLHAAGAIGREGPVAGIDVDLPNALARTELPEPPAGAELIGCVRASLDLLSVASDHLSVPLLGAIYRAPLGVVDFSVHLCGPSGVFKTELAALLQSHFGVRFNARDLPGSWSSTDNALEELAHAAQDMLLTVDDFKPTGSSYEVQAYHRKADRLLRAVGNHSGRQRLTREGKLRADRRPRGLVLSTGEETPHGESLRARLLVEEISYDDIDLAQLSRCQQDAAAGRYVRAMSGYLRWLAARYPALRAELREQTTRLRDRARAELAQGHARAPGLMAELSVGLKYFLDFAVEIQALTEKERTALAQRCWAALGTATAAQAEQVVSAEVTGVFLRLLAAALASGRAHLAGPRGNEPAEPQAWGWRQVEVGGGDHARHEWRAQGLRVGWVETDEGDKVGLVGSKKVYLEPEAAFAQVQALAREQGEAFPISSRTLRRRLHDRGLLASVDKAREVLTVRRVLEGQRREVLHLRTELVYQQPDQPDHHHPKSEKAGSGGGRVAASGQPDPTTNPTTNPTTVRPVPDHAADPTTDPTTRTTDSSSSNAGVVGLVGSPARREGVSQGDPTSTDREVFEI
jgi:hypothetical protein